VKGRHYDVVILGRSIGCLVAAALLARRDFSVLLLGQGTRPAAYRYGERTLLRRPFSLLGASSPALRRALVELAQSQTFRRRTVSLDPMLTVLMPDRRFELPPDGVLFEREIDREFPEVKRVASDLYVALARVNEAADAAFSRDLTWPPGTFWERRRTARVTADLPYFEPGADLLVDFPQFHPYRAVVLGSAAFASDLAPGPRGLPAFSVARLHAAWTRGVVTLPGGEDEMTQFFVDRIAAHGGSVMLDERAERVVASRSGVSGVVMDGDVGATGCRFLLTDMPGEELATLAGGEGLSAAAQRAWPRLQVGASRFVMSLIVKREGVPAALGPETLAFGLPPAATPDPRRPLVRLVRAGARDGEELLVAETRLARGGLAPTDARLAVLGTLRSYLPWLERHLVMIDSPHDGLSAWLYENGVRREIDRLRLAGGGVRAERMEAQIEIDAPAFAGLGAEPLRGPIERTFLLGKTVLPALGQEGELLASLSAARLVTKSDPRREKMRLEMWNKVEIG
jgi:hypothetical protein